MSFKVKCYPLHHHPHCDSVWSLSTGPDGRIYIAACCERKPGGTVKCLRYNSDTDTLDLLFDLAEEVNDPFDSGRATQCKIHYSFVPGNDGILYMATHLSGPPFDQNAYSPWASWNDQNRCFRGAALLAYDTRNDKTIWHDTLFPKEGCRCLAHDHNRGLLYAISYPRDHLFVYDIKTMSSRDLGRIGSVNSQCLFLDDTGRVWTTNDYGYLIRYTPDFDRLEVTPVQIPFDPRLQSGWHRVLYDAVSSPQGDCIYAVTWSVQPRLVRFWPNQRQWGRVEDLGIVNEIFDLSRPVDYYTDHVGGLVFGSDGMLYLAGSQWDDDQDMYEPGFKKTTRAAVWKYDPDTMTREKVAVLEHENRLCHYVSRAAMDSNGDLFFATVDMVNRPYAIFKVYMQEQKHKHSNPILPRMWG
jgi:hypothetical protein